MRLKWHKSGVSAFLLGMLLYAGLACAQTAGLGLEGLLREGQAALESRDFKQAATLSEQALGLAEQLPREESPELIQALTLLARAQAGMANYEQALALQLRALTISEKSLGADHVSMADSLNEISSLYLKLGRNQQALAMSLRALAAAEKTLGPGQATTAAMLEGLASVHLELGQYAAALPLCQRAVSIREIVQGPEHLDLALGLNLLAVVHGMLGQHQLALPLHLRALAMAERLIGTEKPDVAAILGDLAQTYKSLGQLDKALPLQQRALAIREKVQGPEHPDTASTLVNLAISYARMGQYEKALPMQMRALAINEKVLGPEHAVTAQNLLNLAFTHARLGQHEQTLPLLRRALAINEKVLGPGHPETAMTLNNLAVNHSALGQYEQALPLQQRALAIREKNQGPSHPLTATSLNNLGNSHILIAQYELALPYLLRALAIREKALGPVHPDTASTLNNLATVYRMLGRYDEALPFHQRTFVVFHEAYGPDHPSTALALSGLAHIHQAIGDLPLAIALLKQSVNAFQSVRERAAKISNATLRSYTDSVSTVYQRLAAALTDAGRLPEAQMVLDMLKEEEQFDFIRRSLEVDPGRTRIGYNPTEQKWMSRYQEISGQVAAIGAEQQGLLKLGKQGLSAEQKQRQLILAADLKVAQAAFDAFMTAMREDFARQGPARQVDLAESSVKALADLRIMLAGLGQGSLLLQIYLSEDQVNLLLTSPGVQLARSSKVSAKDLNRQIAAFRRLLRDPKSDPLPAAQALYQLLIAPVAKDLEQAGARTVMLSLDGALRYLPFGALHDGRRYLAQRWNLPLYTSVARERLRDAVAPQWQAAGLGVTRQLGEFAPLPGVEAEIRGIVRGGNGGKAANKSAALAGEVYLDGAFTAQRLKDVSQRQFPVLHIASHFRFSPGTEVNSFLLLGDGQQLTLGDIRQQNYRFDHVDLLTLSACDTGLGGGRDEQGREIEGFGVIAQQQGARAVLATLWPVADQSTAALMADMYRKRQSLHLSKIEALRQAQLALQAQPRYRHPFYWAPFILMGNWK